MNNENRKEYIDLKEKDLKEFQVLYKKYYGIDVTLEQVEILGTHLIGFMSFIFYE